MAKMFVKAIMGLITAFFNIIFGTIFNTAVALFPDLGQYLTAILSFLEQALTYVGFVKSVLFIPNSVFVTFFNYLLIKYTIYTIFLGVKFIKNIYVTLKP